MGKSIRMIVALGVIVSSLAFSAIGVARAASGLVLNAFPGLAGS